jgi:p24 family protein beta-1
MKAIVVLALLVAATVALTTKIEPRAEDCFVEDVGKDIPLSFQFKVTAGGMTDIDCTIFDASGRVIKTWHATTEGHHTVHGDATNTKFTFCFSNKMARFTPKWVSFYLQQGPNPSVAKVEHLDPIEKSIIHLSESLNELQDEQKVLRQVEHDHRNTVEDTNERILMWSLFEAAALLGMGLFQIYFLKRFLEVKSSV